MNWYKKAKNKKKDIEEFDYGKSIHNLWHNILQKEMDRVNIRFDLENDDGWDIKTKNLDYKESGNDWSDEWRIKARICWAGGDWEASICYFRCQYEKRSYYDKQKKWSHWEDKLKTIIIPEKNNLNLTKGEKGKVALDADDSKSNEIKDNDLWDEMVEIANKRIKHYWNEYMNQEESGDHSFKNTGCVRELTNLMSSNK